MKKRKNIKPKFWYNTKYNNLTVKKTPFEKFKSAINTNSRIFFGADKNIDHETLIAEKVIQAENVQISNAVNFKDNTFELFV